ncbi:MAG: hypothetical protein QT05_C0007G0013 [archaeon GW2011_AR13]|nr:MAG: hypothetical protein QT05_C0007G0013 [archaeon GW2011_AR13]HIG94032.1 hypothetical protein [Nanoarchaeota archaeon]HIH63776.1 hypothetical protein [Nanoarchaeota archaeon]HIJ09649.1 hypothetical protein [Nanoarchaeota archaeon]
MKLNFIFLIAFSLFLICFAVISSIDYYSIDLVKGKNNVTFNITDSFYVETLVKLNPEIEAVSFQEGDEIVGYVNFLEGIGENFVIFPNKTYEVIVKENVSLSLPYYN